MAISDLVKDNICRLKPYLPGKPIEEVEREFGITNVLKLASNENPLGPSPKAVEAMMKAIGNVALYPDGSSFYLIKALANHCDVTADMITVGNGSDDLIQLVGLTFLAPGDEVIVSETTFSRYEAAATLNCCVVREVPMKDFTYDLEAMADQINDKTRMIFVTNPNNPTGTAVNQAALDKFMARVPENVIVILDEAYKEYVEAADYPDSLNYVNAGKNVIILYTFSKIYALAGLRVGYAIARPELIQCLNQVREPFNVNSIAQIGAVASIQDKDQVSRSRKMNSEGKRYLYKAFDAMGLPYVPSEANFVWVNLKTDCRPVFQNMLRRGVIVRTGDIFGYPDYIRVTIGSEAENKRFIDTLTEVLA